MDIEHWYYIDPGHGTGKIRARFIDPIAENPHWEQPFLVKEEELSFSAPNHRCNNLRYNDRLPWPDYSQARPLRTFEVFTTDHFVVYCSPETPAYRDIHKITADREAALKSLIDFAGTAPKEKIIMFFYPDGPTKRMCTSHTGDGMAMGNMLAEVYNETTKVDASHELAHIVMGEIGQPPAMFNEGFAVSRQSGRVWDGKAVDATARELLKSAEARSVDDAYSSRGDWFS